MYILSVIPIVRGVAPETLSYYTSKPVPEGAIVEIPLRRKFVPALVLTATDASKQKTDIRRASFTLKKIKRVVAEEGLPKEVLVTCRELAEFYATSLGVVLHTLLPQIFFEYGDLFPASSLATHKKIPTLRHTPRLIQLPFDERLTRYRSIVRETLAKGTSVIFLTPTIAEAELLFDELSRGIEDRVHLLTSARTKRQQRETWKKAANEKDSVVVVGTPTALLFFRKDLTLYILEHEGSPYYKMSERPFIDIREAAITLARIAKRQILLGDSFARIETLANVFDHTYEEILKPVLRQASRATTTLVDMRSAPHERGEAPPLSPLSYDAIVKAVQTGGRTFVYATRRGHTPLTLCRDCGTILVCDACDAPMVLHEKRKPKDSNDTTYRIFECHRCGRTKDAKTLCSVCGGWRLYAYGVGVERVHEAISTHGFDASLYLLTNDTTKTHKDALRVRDAWEKSENGILVGTQRALPYIRGTRVASSVIASVDTLTMLPDISMQEKIFGLVSYIRELTDDTVVLQTRNPELEILMLSALGDGLALYQTEMQRRKEFGYPPYTVCVKITCAGKQEEVLRALEKIRKDLIPHEVSVYPAFVSKVKGGFVAHALLNVPKAAWPEREVIAVLRALPPAYRVEVNPESVL